MMEYSALINQHAFTKMKLKFAAKVVDGTLKVSRRSEFVEALNGFEGKEITITVEKKKKERSLQQNAYYWGVVIPLTQTGLIETGNKFSKEETHELLKYKFLQQEKVNEETGEIFKYLGGSSELTTTQFMEYILDIQQWAAEYLNIQVPSPNEQLTADF